MASKLRYGDEVICLKENSPWYGEVGTIGVMNKDNAGVLFRADPDPPATGRWVEKTALGRIDDLDDPSAVPWLTRIHVADCRVRGDFSIPIGGDGTHPRHVILTGPNGSGKTSILEGLWKNLLSTGPRVAPW